MKIRMKETRRGTEDGFKVTRYEYGKVYDVSDTLARTFINAGYASHHIEPLPASDKNNGMTEQEKHRLEQLRIQGVMNMTHSEVEEFQHLAKLGIRQRFGGERLFVLGSD